VGDKFNYSHDFKGMQAIEVFDGIIAWLKAEEAKIDRLHKPTEIEAYHGSLKALMVWKKNAEKTMSFRISEAEGAVHVDLSMTPASKAFGDDVYAWQKKIKTVWGQLADDLWTRLEESKQSG
jgi:hypothetical protein